MADPQLVLILLIAAKGSDARGTTQVGGAAREALGADVSLLLEDRESEPADDAAIETAIRIHASAIATVRWTDVEHREAVVRMYVPNDARWYDRKLSFRTVDAPSERDRAVGYLLGTMVRASLRFDRDPSPSFGPPAIAPPPEGPQRPPSAGSSPPRFAVDLAATGSLGVGGSATGLGPSGRFHFFATEHLGFAAGAAARFGTIPDADASTRTLRGSAGITWRAESPRLSILLALDALLLHHWAEREEPRAARSRWISGAGFGASVGLRISPTVEPFVGAGVEVALGATPVTLAGQEVAEIPPLRVTVDAGVRVRF